MALNKNPDDNQLGTQEYTSQFDELESFADKQVEEEAKTDEFLSTDDSSDYGTATEDVDKIFETSNADSSEVNDEDNNTSESSTYTSQFGELEGYVDDYSSGDFQGEVNSSIIAETPKKKMSPKKLAVILGITVAVIAALALGIYFVFFNHSIKGTWVIENNGTKIYYTFNDTTLDMSVTNGYMKEKLSYNISYENDDKFSYMAGEQIYQSFKYKVDGNLLQGKTLTLYYDGYETSEGTVLTYALSPENIELAAPAFTKNEDIIGYWKSTDGYNSYMEFKDNGSLHNYYVTTLYFDDVQWKYNYDGKNVITISSGTTDENGNTTGANEELKVPTKIEDNKLIITNTSNNEDTVYVKSSKEEFEEYKTQVLNGTYVDPTDVSTQQATEVTTEEATATSAE